MVLTAFLAKLVLRDRQALRVNKVPEVKRGQLALSVPLVHRARKVIRATWALLVPQVAQGP